jgi:hypothetical protein
MKKLTIHYEHKGFYFCNNNIKIEKSKMSDDINDVTCQFCLGLYKSFNGGKL